jgi:hypothetical protein
MIIDDTQIYITGVLYQYDAFPSDPKILFGYIDEKLREITLLEYQFLSINRSENRFSNGTTREQLLIFMKDIKYNNVVFLSDSGSAALRTTLINKLNSLLDITYNDVEIRTTRTVI